MLLSSHWLAVLIRSWRQADQHTADYIDMCVRVCLCSVYIQYQQWNNQAWPFQGYQIKEHCLYRFDSKLLVKHSLNSISLHASPLTMVSVSEEAKCVNMRKCLNEVEEQKVHTHTMFANFLFTLINLEFILPFIGHTHTHTHNNQVDQHTHFLYRIHMSLSVVRALCLELIN